MKFDLPVLREEVAGWARALETGWGFVLVRGFPTDELTPEQTELRVSASVCSWVLRSARTRGET